MALLMKYVEGRFYKIEKGEKDGPYCEGCYRNRAKKIKLLGMPGDPGNLLCPECSVAVHTIEEGGGQP